MPYERVDIAAPAAQMPQAQQPQMREERVFEPYKVAKSPPRSPDNGQITINNSAKPEEPQVATAETVTLSPAAAALARKEQAFRKQQMDLKTREEAIAKEAAEIAELRALKAKLEAKDYSGIESQISYDDYTNYLIDKSAGTSPELQELKSLKSEVEGVKKAHQDEISKRFEAAVNERRKAVTTLIDSSKDFPTIKKSKQHEAVVQHILDTWEHDNIDLDPLEAAKEVEAIIKENAAKWAGLLEAEPKVDPDGEKKTLPPLKQGIKTLTNNMTATGDVKRPLRSYQGMTDSERWAEARRRAEEKLKG